MSNFSIQTGEAILYIHLDIAGNNSQRYHVQLFHQQLVKGIPSFRLQDLESVQLFINGFLFGEIAGHGYDFYCTAMESVFFGNDELLNLFNALRKKGKQHLLNSPEKPLDNRRALR